jgi:hypothetical protein
MPRKPPQLPDWEKVLFAAAHLQRILPDAVLVGGTASALHAKHRVPLYADHVLTDLSQRFEAMLGQLESVAGWQTARVQRPVEILGSLDGILTGVRQLIRTKPLETETIRWHGQSIELPTTAEMLRIKTILVLRRNATRDYLDFVALDDKLGAPAAADALRPLDSLYPQPNGESPLQQLIVQLADPLPYDLEETRLGEYRRLIPRWRDWNTVRKACARCAVSLFDLIAASTRTRGQASRSSRPRSRPGG